ncbi:MAG: BrnA antitoxin family protein [Rhizobiales bacterium]|nr:BrnA antitoxin family protein [Hyphomicrobiales bacterium]
MRANKNVTKPGLNPDDDAPELTDEWFARGKLYVDGKPIRRGRPKGSGTKELVSLRLDKEALAAFRASGRGWQVRINDAVTRAAKRLQRQA